MTLLQGVCTRVLLPLMLRAATHSALTLSVNDMLAVVFPHNYDEFDDGDEESQMQQALAASLAEGVVDHMDVDGNAIAGPSHT